MSPVIFGFKESPLLHLNPVMQLCYDKVYTYMFKEALWNILHFGSKLRENRNS
jgi:hypothetical protein